MAVFAVVSALATLHAPPRLEALASRLTGGSRAAEVSRGSRRHVRLAAAPLQSPAIPCNPTNPTRVRLAQPA